MAHISYLSITDVTKNVENEEKTVEVNHLKNVTFIFSV
jgi:hypothetical protein